MSPVEVEKKHVEDRKFFQWRRAGGGGRRDASPKKRLTWRSCTGWAK
ncbi:MAG: hypothetical protein ABFS45_27720 [Pseudomonadota bacterium]